MAEIVPDSPNGSEDSGTCTPLPEEPQLDPHHFTDDMATTVGDKIAPPAEVRPSSSEGRLVDKSSANLVSRLKGLPFMKGAAFSGRTSDPFEAFSSVMSESHTRFIML